MLSHPHYQSGERLTSRMLKSEQDYLRQRLRNHNRFLHGCGVVCGLEVVRDPRRPSAVRICPGYAVTPCGDPIEICCAQTLDIGEWLWSRPPGVSAAYVVIRYIEREERPVEAPSKRCCCDDPRREPSRLHDGYSIEVLWEPPPASGPLPDLCRPGPTPCPVIESVVVVLAQVTVLESPAGTLGLGPISPAGVNL